MRVKKAKNIILCLMVVLVLLPGRSFGQYRSYGNEIFRLAASPGEESFGLISGLIYSGGENVRTNPFALEDPGGKDMWIGHSLWFSSSLNATSFAYSIPAKNGKVSALMVSRIGSDNVPDSRDALLDYGADGIPGTMDEGENNGLLDPGERLDRDRIIMHSLNNYTVTFSFPYRINELEIGISARLMLQDLIASKGYGMSFDLFYLKSWNNIQSLSRIGNLPSAVTFYDNGKQESYAPYLESGLLMSNDLSIFTIQPGLLIQYIPGAKVIEAESMTGLESLTLLPVVHVKIASRFSSGMSYYPGAGLKLATELDLSSFSLQYAWRGHKEDDIGMSHIFALKFSLADLLRDQ